MDAELTRLIRQVFAHPDDDGVRGVVADALIERTHPRGEFIALQLSPAATEAQRQRALELERAHGREWAGIPDIDNVEYRRGFPSLVRTSICTDAEAWATVETLVIAHRVEPIGPFLSRSPHLASLRRVVNLGAAELATLSEWKTPRLEALELAYDLPQPAVAHLLGRPGVKELSFSLSGDAVVPPRWFWNRELLRRLELVRLRAVSLARAPDLSPLAARSTKHAPVLRYESFLGFSIEFEPDCLVARVAWRAQLEAVSAQLFALIATNVPKVAARFQLFAGSQPVEPAAVPVALRPFLTPPTPSEGRTRAAKAPGRARGSSRGRGTVAKS